MGLCDSRLFEDLHGAARDVAYRASSYVHHSGGPAVGDAETRADLHEHCDEVLRWLLAQDELGEILAGYDGFVERWSPVFPD